MATSKFNVKLPRRVTSFIALAATAILLLFFSQFVVSPDVQAVTHAALHTIGAPPAQIVSMEAGGVVDSIWKGIAGEKKGEPIRLPFLKVRDPNTKLVRYVYSITLDEKALGAGSALLDTDALQLKNIYGLLFVQVVNGGDFFLNGHWVDGLAQSTQAERWIWNEPFIVQLPSRLLKTDGTPNVLTIVQSTLEPYISIPRLYFGTMNELNRISSVVHFLVTVLGNVFITLCLVAGLFFLAVPIVSPKDYVYAWAGGVNILWALLFLIFRISHFNTDAREFWRFAVFLVQGGVVGMTALFIFSFIGQPLGRLARNTIFGLSVTEAVVYAVGGSAIDRYLTLFWSPVLMLLYVYATARLAAYFWKTRSTPAGLFLLQTGLFCALGLHTYGVNGRLIDKINHSGLEGGWGGLLFERIMFLHLGLPFLLISATYILLVSHGNSATQLENSKLFLKQREIELKEIHAKRETIARSKATMLERDRIYQDIHDGIGSQLVLAIFNLRNIQADSSAVMNNLQACLQDLRLVIDAQPESNIDIQTTVFAFCVTQELQLEDSGLEMRYHVGLESTVYADPKVQLNILRVLQESLCNIIKHSGATFVEVKLASSAIDLTLTISDNGCGQRRAAHQLLEQHSAYGASGNRGIKGLALRAADIGATYTINITESGTIVSLSIPLPDQHIGIKTEVMTQAVV